MVVPHCVCCVLILNVPVFHLRYFMLRTPAHCLLSSIEGIDSFVFSHLLAYTKSLYNYIRNKAQIMLYEAVDMFWMFWPSDFKNV